MSDQGFYQKGINADSNGVGGTLTAAATIGGGGTYALDSSGGAFTATLPSATIGAGVVVTLFGTDANLAGGAVTVAAAAGESIDGIATVTTAVNSAQSYISDGVDTWVAFPYAI